MKDDGYETLITVGSLASIYTLYYFFGVKATQKFNEDETKALFRIHVFLHNKRKAGEMNRGKAVSEAPRALRKGSGKGLLPAIVGMLSVRAGRSAKTVAVTDDHQAVAAPVLPVG